MDWPKFQISALGKIGSGTTPKRGTSGYYGGEIPWVKSGELNSDIITDTEEKITQLAMEKHSALKIIPKGSLLVAMYGATVGQVAFLDIEATSNQAVCHIIPNKEIVEPRYLFHFLKSLKQYWLSRRVGGGQPNISMKIVKETEISLPPLDAQRRIAAILDKAKGIKSLSKEIPKIRNELIQSIFSNMFGDKLISIKPQIDFIQLSTISRKTKNLDPRTRPNMEFEMYSIPAFDLGAPQVLQGSEIGSSKKILIENDVVISRLIPHIRRVWVIPKTSTMMKLGSSEWIVFNSENFNPIFLQYLLSSDEFHKYFMNSVAGVGGSLVRARPIVVMGLYIKRPTMDLQNIFAHNVESIKSLPDINDLTIQNSKSLSQEMLT